MDKYSLEEKCGSIRFMSSKSNKHIYERFNSLIKTNKRKKSMSSYDEEKLKSEGAKYAPKNEDEINEKVIGKEDELNKKFATIAKLKPYWEDFKTIFSMIKDWVTGKYKQAPFTTIASLAGVLLYVLSPIDLVADIIPILGYMDDAALLGLAIKMASADIEKYRQWKNTIDVPEKQVN